MVVGCCEIFLGSGRSLMGSCCGWFDGGSRWVLVRDFTEWCWVIVDSFIVVVGDLESS